MIRAALSKVTFGLVAPPDPGAMGKARSPRWRSVRDAHLDWHPMCAACGEKKHLNVHHIEPFHVAPTRELDIENLITLCEHPSHNCHLLFGHCLSWKAYNPFVRGDAAHMLEAIASRRGEKP